MLWPSELRGFRLYRHLRMAVTCATIPGVLFIDILLLIAVLGRGAFDLTARFSASVAKVLC